MEGLLSNGGGLMDGGVREVLIPANILFSTLILCRQWQIETLHWSGCSLHDEELSSVQFHGSEGWGSGTANEF